MRLDILAVIAMVLGVAHIVGGGPAISPDRKAPRAPAQAERRVSSAKPSAVTKTKRAVATQVAKPPTASSTAPRKGRPVVGPVEVRAIARPVEHA